MNDSALKVVSLWIAGLAGALAVASIALPQLQPIIKPAAIFVAGLATLLFLRMLFSRSYRSAVNHANLEMQGSDPWPGLPKKFSDPEWGLFGRRAGGPALLRVRAVLFIGLFPIALAQNWIGLAPMMLWFAATFVACELSIMHLAIEGQSQQI